MLQKFSDIEKKLSKRSQKRRLVAAAVQDSNIINAVMAARDNDVVDITLIGNEKKIHALSEELSHDLSDINIINEEDDYKAGHQAVGLINTGEAHILMNGQENYHGAAVIGRAVIDKKTGIRKGKLISHLALCEIEGYPKLIGITDPVMHIHPSLKEKAGIISNAVFFMRILGVEKPKVAVLAAIETVNEAMGATTDAAMLAKMSQRGQLKNCIIEGPLAFDNAISREHAQHKGIIDEVSGDPDILLAPDIETAGVLYQSLVFFAKAKVASVAIGASCPIVLTAGIDSRETRLNSIKLAASLYD